MKNNTLNKLLEKNKITAKKLSDATGIDVSTLSKMRHFERGISQVNAIIIANYFNISVDELYDRDYPATKKENLSYNEVILLLDDFNDKELLSLSGAIDFLLLSRSEESSEVTSKKEVENRKYY